MIMENKAGILSLNIPQNKRIICVSDVHGHLNIFKKLLDKVRFCESDILILAGDICIGRHNNGQNLQTLEFSMELLERGNVYAVRGNWELPERLPADWDGAVRMRAMEWFESLPHIIETRDYIFVHAGLTSDDLSEQDAEECMRIGASSVKLEKYIIAGHVPTLNRSGKLLSCNPIIETTRRHISIDGGLDKWGCGQLNALIIQNGAFSYESDDDLPVIRANKAQRARGGDLSIVWTKDKEVRIIRAGAEFSVCKHTKSGKTIKLSNESLNADENGGLWCSLDTDYYLPVDAGDEITVLHTYGDRIFAKKDGILGYYKTNGKPEKQNE